MLTLRLSPVLSHMVALSRAAMRAKVAAALLGLIAIFAADAAPNPPLANLRNWVFDAYERYLPRSRSPAQAVMIDIDSQSIRHVGQWPWPHDKLARLVDSAAAARVIGIDLLLVEPDRLAGSDHETDQMLAASLRRVPVVLAAAADPRGASSPKPPIIDATPIFETGEDPRAALPHFRSIAWPYPTLAGAARGIGFITVPPEADGIMRRMPTLASVGSVLIPCFAIEVVRTASGADWIGLRIAADGEQVLEIGDRVIHTDSAGGVWPDYSVKPGSLSFSADRVLEGEISADAFRDRIVLIGSSAPGLGDAFETPLRRLQSGVSIQAQLVDSLLGGNLLWRPRFALALERLLALALAIAAMLQFGRMRDRTYVLLCGGVVILLGAGSFAAFVAAGLLIDATFPAVALLGTNIILLAERTHREVLTRRQREAELAIALRQAELHAEAEHARESLAIALDSAQMGIWDADLVRGTCRRSPRYNEIFDCADAPATWSREILLASVVAEDQPAVACSLDTAMATGTLHFECHIRRPDGNLRSIVVDGRVYHGADGTPVRIAGVATDVSERRRIEEALQQSQRLQSIGTIAGGVAHNFNNLLTIILGNIDLALRWSSDIARLRGHLEAASQAAEQGANLTWRLLAFARQQPLCPEPIELSGQLRNLANLIGESFPANVKLETDIPPDLWVVEADASEFQLALLNLCFNGRDAMLDGGTLHISARNRLVENDRPDLSGRYVVIDITDDGAGVPPELLPRVFEPFMTTKDDEAGVGLGLSQVHGFVHQSGGVVEIESEPGKGTTVRMFLPAAPPAIAAAALPHPETAYPTTGVVLVVEDQPDLANLAGELFRQSQLEIKIVRRASDALEHLRSRQPVALVFSDVMMPDGMNGVELAELMKTEFPDIPILLTTGYSDVAAAAAAKGFHVIRKPYRLEDLATWARTSLHMVSPGLIRTSTDL